jgi:F0F1-type ATP synthase membrane subunit b/b'
MSLDLTQGIGDAIKAAVPQLTDALKGAEASLADDLKGAQASVSTDLQGVEDTFTKGETNALQALERSIARAEALLERIHGGTITATATVTFNFPPKS